MFFIYIFYFNKHLKYNIVKKNAQIIRVQLDLEGIHSQVAGDCVSSQITVEEGLGVEILEREVVLEMT